MAGREGSLCGPIFVVPPSGGIFPADAGSNGPLDLGDDVNGDGVPEIITAPGAGGGPHVRVWNVGPKLTPRSFIKGKNGAVNAVAISASGKTLVYLEAIRRALINRRTAQKEVRVTVLRGGETLQLVASL